jgi:hypothetical protein
MVGLGRDGDMVRQGAQSADDEVAGSCTDRVLEMAEN